MASSNDAAIGAESATTRELRLAAQQSIRDLLRASADDEPGRRRWAVPAAATAAVAAAACIPVVLPLLPLAAASAGGAAVMAAALVQIGGLSTNLLSEAVLRAWERLPYQRQESAEQGQLQAALTADLESRLVLGTAAATVLRREVAGVLRGVGAVQITLTADGENSGWDVRELLIRGLREIGTEFAEFGWILDEVNQQITTIAQDIARAAATSREIADNQQQTLVELALLRRQTRPTGRHSIGIRDLSVTEAPGGHRVRIQELDSAGVAVSPLCPYPGLSAFQPQDAERFHGRTRLTADLLIRLAEQLERPGLLMVVGSSGSGKSSLLRAGLLPAVMAGELAVPGSQTWPRDIMTPGRRPLLELATRVASLAGIPAGALETDLRADPARIVPAVRQALLVHNRRHSPMVIDIDAIDTAPRLLLVVDQFEEVFSQCPDEQERRSFVQALSLAAGATGIAGAPRAGVGLGMARNAPALVVIGLRADFYAAAANYPELAPHLQDRQLLVGPIERTGLRNAIEEPARAGGLVVETALVEALLADLGLRGGVAGSYEAGRLALLSYALQQTWTRREGRCLTVAGYRAAGGIDGAIAQAADSLFARLPTDEQEALRRVLMRMVSLGQGTPDTRRRVTRDELAQLDARHSGPTATTLPVLDALIDARLVTAEADTVEITHETLLTAWPQLQHWLGQDRTGLRIHRDLTEASRFWQNENHDPSHLFRGTRLAITEEWALRHSPDLNAAEQGFLQACRHHRRRGIIARRAAISALTLLTITSVVATALIGSAVNAADRQRAAALRQRDQAVAGEALVKANQLRNSDPSLAAQLELVAERLHPVTDTATQLLNTAMGPLATPLYSHRDRRSGGTPITMPVAIDPRGRLLAAGSIGDGIRLWDLTRHDRPLLWRASPTGNEPYARTIAFSPNGRFMATVRNAAELWDLSDPAQPVLMRSIPQQYTEDPSTLAYSHQGLLAIATNHGIVHLVDLSNPRHPRFRAEIRAGDHRSTIWSVAFSSDGHTLATADGAKARVWNILDPGHPKLTSVVGARDAAIDQAALSPDGRTLATVKGTDTTVRLWDLHQPDRPEPLGSSFSSGTMDFPLTFSPDGNTLVTRNETKLAQLWNVADPNNRVALGPALPDTNTTFTIEAAGAGFSADGQLLAIANNDGTVRIWSVPAARLESRVGAVGSVAFSPDGQALATTNVNYAGPPRAEVWDLSNHQARVMGPLLTLSQDSFDDVLGNSAAFSLDGRTLTTLGNGTARIWTMPGLGQPRTRTPPLLTKERGIAVLSNDGRIAAISDYTTGVQLWDLTKPRPTRLGQTFSGTGGSSLTDLAFSPDARLLAGYGQQVNIWDITDPQHPASASRPLLDFNADNSVQLTSLCFSPDGRTLAAGTVDGTVLLVTLGHATNRAQIGQPFTVGTGIVSALAFSPDGRTLATGDEQGSVRLLNLTSGGQITSLGQPFTYHHDQVTSMAFSPDGRTLATGSTDRTTQLLDLDLDHAVQRICRATAGALTRAAWNQYLPTVPYDPPCNHPTRYGLLVP